MQTIKILKLPGEKVTTTFWNDFTIADRFGINAVKETFNEAFKSWKNDYRYLTNLVITLNYKACDHAEDNEALAEVYVELYEKARDYACDNLKGKEFEYYFNITD